MATKVQPTLNEIRYFQTKGKQPESLKKRVQEYAKHQEKLDKVTAKFKDLNMDPYLKELRKITDREVLEELLTLEYAGESRASVIQALKSPDEQSAPAKEGDISELTIKEVGDKIENISDISDLKTWAEVEKAGKNRTGALEVIQARIQEVGKDLWPQKVDGGFYQISTGKKFQSFEKAEEEQGKIDLM